ncbi:hypothetical protein AJ80_03608 [Polytolypa hystricis UAMH7299]|uniref:NAD(P)-binding protein n=1 Tax=Polytolypa hystricis (strain UAMH7299) TaxID=1447883 RepID=A0A2B7YGN3_POLH7|nr:hypothetical protein AJ80_03608 [Polytolypa hystricis UAMH7299]
MTFHPDSVPDLTGKVYIVTGGTSGIGYNTVACLAQHGAHIYLCARSSAKGSDAVTGIKTLYPQARITVLEMDHLSLASVAPAAKFFLSREIRNGKQTTSPTGSSPLTSYPLCSALQTLPPGSVRIVNLTSSGHYSTPKDGINFADTSLPNAGGVMCYGQSKLTNILHTKTLNKSYGPGSPSAKAGEGEIWTAAVHPGLVDSQLAAHAEIPKAMMAVFKRIAEKGWQSKLAKDMGLADKLEEWTREEMKNGGWID